MSLYRAQQKEKQVREGVLDLLAYFAVWGLMLDFDTLYQYLQVNTSNLAVKKQLNSLIKRKRVKQVDSLYGLANHPYPSQKKQKQLQADLLKKARRWSLLFRLIPSVKAVVVINSAAYGNVHKDSDIDLFIITSPNRIFITKGLLMYGLKALKQLEDGKQSAGKFSLGMFLTTHGGKFEKDIMKVNEPDLPYRMITGIPTYGAGVWYDILKKDPYLSRTLPNYTWPKTSLRIYGAGWQHLDRLDNLGYRRHLRHTANQPKSHAEQAFIRVRPDIINLHHKGTSAQIAEQWQGIRNKA
jgi:predicted nucleotidyltransferase